MAKRHLPCPTVLRLLLRYEPETGKLFWRHRSRVWFRTDGDQQRWNTRFANSEAMNHDAGRYLVGTIMGHAVLAHRVIWALVHGEWPAVIDHIDGDKHNNRIENLRSVTTTENNRNRPKDVRNTSGHTGVRWCRVAGRWVMQIRRGKDNRISRTFRSKEDALNAYAEWKRALGYTERHGT
jgi:hypothetical protein